MCVEFPTYVLLHVFLPMLEGALAELRCHLGRRVVHELAVCAEDVAARPALLLVRVAAGAAVGMLLGLRGARGRRR